MPESFLAGTWNGCDSQPICSRWLIRNRVSFSQLCSQVHPWANAGKSLIWQLSLLSFRKFQWASFPMISSKKHCNVLQPSLCITWDKYTQNWFLCNLLTVCSWSTKSSKWLWHILPLPLHTVAYSGGWGEEEESRLPSTKRSQAGSW